MVSVLGSALAHHSPPVASTTSQLQLVRWRRKPRWLPVAKSKMFRVPERKPEDPQEREELMRLHTNYKTKMRAVKSYLMEETKRREATSSADHMIVTPEEAEADFERCRMLNEQWNKEVAAVREQRLAMEKLERHAIIAEKVDAKLERDQERRAIAEERVRLEMERAKTFITRENLDRAIEEALANPINHDYAIDLKQNVLRDEPDKEKPIS